MRILSLLNVSNADGLQCDSGYVFQRLLGRALAELGVEFVLVGPEVPAFLTAGSSIPEVRLVTVPLGLTKYAVRYHFDWPALEALIAEEQRRLRPDAGSLARLKKAKLIV